MSTAPTDALALLREIYAELEQGAIPNNDDPWWQRAAACIAKWGQPARAGEPVATIYITQGGAREFDDWMAPLPVGANTLFTAPQPVARAPVAWKHDCAALLTNDVELWIDACPHCGKPRNAPQTVGRWPLTDAQIKGLIEEGVFFGNCKEIVRAIEAAHGIGIKGGQHDR